MGKWEAKLQKLMIFLWRFSILGWNLLYYISPDIPSSGFFEKNNGQIETVAHVTALFHNITSTSFFHSLMISKFI
jgi:hypothetical protein